MNIDLDQLITFERIVREGTFSAAAWALDIPQPTVSARIKTLEQMLGGALFYRRGRQIALTDLGQAFLPYVQRTIAILAEGVQTAQQAEQGQRGRVTFGGLSSLSGAIIGPAITEFYKSRPQVELLVKGGDHESVVGWLRDQLIEIGILVWPCPESVLTPMQVLMRWREPIVLVVGARHPLADKGAISYAELLSAAKPFLSLRWWKTMHPTLEQIAAQSESHMVVSMESARFMVRSGIGLGFFSRAFVLDDLHKGELVELTVHDLQPLHRDIALVRLARETRPNMVTESFIAHIREQVERLGMPLLPVLPID